MPSFKMKQNTKSPRNAIVTIVVMSVLGMILSVYAYHVEANIHTDPNFRALCDISEKMSCSKVFSSRFGTGLGIMEHIVGKKNVMNQPNSVYGMIFYVIQAVLALRMRYSLVILQLITALMGGLTSLYLAFILVYILDDFCVVCISTYIVNFTIIICSFIKYRATQKMEDSRKEKDARKKAS